ncbi:MAG: hypothetical protein HYU64_07820, partial [Armatimonadetes bacterium]|nr:hypothetical protein [Armatimonadota bacterium]
KLSRRGSAAREKLDIPVKKLTGLLPVSLDDPAWETTESSIVSFSPLWQKTPEHSYGSVRALYNEMEVTILLEWSASGPSTSFTRHQDFPDACALQFPVYETSFSELLRAKPRKIGSLIPSFVMGDKGAPVNIWYWRSEQTGTVSRQAMDDYLLDDGDSSSSSFHTGKAVGNPFSLSPGMSAMDMIAEGLGTLTPVPQDLQKVRAVSAWKGGKWRVSFTRPLNPEFAGGARFAPGEKVPISFAVWSGSKGERDGHKSVAGWHFLVLEK